MKMKRTLLTMIMTAGMLTSVHVCGETQPCSIMSVEISKENVLTITADPADAQVTYTITSEDAVAASGPSGLKIDLTGKYLLECRAWKQDTPQSVPVACNIEWENPEFLAEPPADEN